MSLGPRRGPKLIPQTAMTSQMGVNLVEKRVMQMGHAWHPTTAAFDAGIDGFIDLRDPATSESLNLIVQVQVKATEGMFINETDKTLEFVCDSRDLAHWRRGNAPVVLVLTRPKTDEAYWVSIKDYFKNPLALKDRRLRFEKARDKFDASASTSLQKLAVPSDAGLYVAPLTKAETIFSNLLRVSRLPSQLYAADTHHPRRYEVEQALGENRYALPEFVYRGKRIVSVHDLAAPQWRGIVDAGTVEPFPTSDWAQSEDPDQLNDFTELLGRCLSSRLWALGMRFDMSKEYYYFTADPEKTERQISYSSVKQQTSRFVCKRYSSKSGFIYYRHSAFSGQFKRYDGEWFLSIVPSYRFTQDGRAPLKYYESKLKGIKALEKNASVLGQVYFFASILKDAPRDLFNLDAEPNPFLGFGELKAFSVDVGLNDDEWLPTDDEKETAKLAAVDELEMVADDSSTLPQLFDAEGTTR